MKIERMLYIITHLLNHEKVKARDLADKFEVSVRTIYRDIEAISQAGIPIVTYQGADGGIGIVEGYKLDKSLLTSGEVLNIVAGLKGLQSVNDDLKIKSLIEKFTSIANKSGYVSAGNEIMIDLSSWNPNDQLALRVQEIKEAIQDRKIVEFVYYSNESLTKRKVEPCIIVFKATSWYLYGYCLLRKDFRLFKLRRISNLKISDTAFEPKEFSIDNVKWDGEFERDRESMIVVLFDGIMKYAVNDIFGVDNYEVTEDGKLKVTFHMGISQWLYGFLLGFGDKVQILEPAELRDKIRDMAESVCKIYDDKE